LLDDDEQARFQGGILMQETVASSLGLSHRDALEQLRNQHRWLEDRLVELGSHRSLSPEEQYEVALIKKRKLFLKDRIRSLEAYPAT
jgi:hypothetical protein